ncbi:MAG: MerC domain-containing protein [Pseudomonadota bacterium]
MAGRSPGTTVVDGSAIVLSSLCLIHCLALPLLSAVLPIAGVWAEAEWLHRAFVLAAIPFSLIGLSSKRLTVPIGILIASGIGFLLLGAFVESLHDYETQLTVIGALLLASGHALRWSNASLPSK